MTAEPWLVTGSTVTGPVGPPAPPPAPPSSEEPVGGAADPASDAWATRLPGARRLGLLGLLSLGGAPLTAQPASATIALTIVAFKAAFAFRSIGSSHARPQVSSYAPLSELRARRAEWLPRAIRSAMCWNSVSGVRGPVACDRGIAAAGSTNEAADALGPTWDHVGARARMCLVTRARAAEESPVRTRSRDHPIAAPRSTRSGLFWPRDRARPRGFAAASFAVCRGTYRASTRVEVTEVAMDRERESHVRLAKDAQRVVVARGRRWQVVHLRRLYLERARRRVRRQPRHDVWVAAGLRGDLFALAFDFLDEVGAPASRVGEPKLDSTLFAKGWLDIDTRERRMGRRTQRSRATGACRESPRSWPSIAWSSAVGRPFGVPSAAASPPRSNGANGRRERRRGPAQRDERHRRVKPRPAKTVPTLKTAVVVMAFAIVP